jgi:hypothetical protein
MTLLVVALLAALGNSGSAAAQATQPAMTTNTQVTRSATSANHRQQCGTGPDLWPGAAWPVPLRVELAREFGIAPNYTLSLSTWDQTTSFTQHSRIPGVSQNAFIGTLYLSTSGSRGACRTRGEAGR